MQPLKVKELQTYVTPVAKSKSIEWMTDKELVSMAGSAFVFDIEVYPNYFLIAFKHTDTKKVVVFEISPDGCFNKGKLRWLLANYKIIGFNSIVFDAPVMAYSLLNTVGIPHLNEITQSIIFEDMRPFHVEKRYGFKIPNWNHVDLIEVAPLSASLKVYAGRMHADRMQDLPYAPDMLLNRDQAKEVLEYCINDLDNTLLLYEELRKPLQLRENMSAEYDQDLRSRSDAQIAEYVIGGEIKKITGSWPKSPKLVPGETFKYETPAYLQFKNPQLQYALQIVEQSQFEISDAGKLIMPKAIKELKIAIGESQYQMGIGGLHSCESQVSRHTDEDATLYDRDVASYYPRIILNLGLYPKHLGERFLEVYNKIVETRLDAKHSGDKETSNSLKIVINGSFGKLGNKHSILCSPRLLMQVTITGQLSLLLLIERLEIVGIPVVSANTDGIVCKVPTDKHAEYLRVVAQWENDTQFETEETKYRSVYYRDVNNYIAIKPDGEVKTKGKYSEVGSALNSRLSKNPENLICNDAVKAFLNKNVPIEQTINNCNDIKRFITVRTVKGGAIKDGQYLGKVVRWYYKKGEHGTINYVTSSNKVPRSEGGWPCMDLPKKCPDDIDRRWYINEAYSILEDIGFYGNSEPSFLI